MLLKNCMIIAEHIVIANHQRVHNIVGMFQNVFKV